MPGELVDIVIARLQRQPIDDQQDDPADQEGPADQRGRLPEVALDEIAQQHARHHGRQAGQDHRKGELPGIGLAGQRIADQQAQLGEIDGDDGQDRPELDQHDEGRRLGQAEEMAGQQQVAGGADRQEFGKAFENSQHQRHKKTLIGVHLIP